MKPKLTKFNDRMPVFNKPGQYAPFVGWKCVGAETMQIGRTPEEAQYRWFEKLLREGWGGTAIQFLRSLPADESAKFYGRYMHWWRYKETRCGRGEVLRIDATYNPLPIRQAWKDVEQFATWVEVPQPRTWWQKLNDKWRRQ